MINKEEEQKAKKEELDEDLAKNKRRMLGNIKFIGELFKLKVCKLFIRFCVYYCVSRYGNSKVRRVAYYFERSRLCVYTCIFFCLKL